MSVTMFTPAAEARNAQALDSVSHLRRLEAESIHIFREVAAEFKNPVLLYSIGKDSSVLLHLAMKAFYPAKPPFPLMHVDTTWKFKEMIAFRDETARRLGLELRVHINEEGVRNGVSPIASGSSVHTQVMKTEGLRQALDKYGFDAAFGGARRDEEKSRAKERIFSFRDSDHGWDPRNQRPELWRLFNTRVARARASASSRSPTGPSSTCGNTSGSRKFRSWTCISPRSARSSARGHVDHGRRRALAAQSRRGAQNKLVRFRTLGCYPLSGAIEVDARRRLRRSSRK